MYCPEIQHEESVPQTDLENLLSSLIEYFSSGDFYQEAILAREEFDRDFKGIEEGDQDFSMYNRRFFDYFLFDYVLSEKKCTAIEWYYRARIYSNPQQKMHLLELISSRYSLFEVVKIKKEALVVLDILQDKKYEVKTSYYSVGIEKGDLLETRIVKNIEQWDFVLHILKHPAEAKKFLRKKYKNIPPNKDFLLELNHYWRAYKLFKTKMVKEIYSEKSVLQRL